MEKAAAVIKIGEAEEQKSGLAHTDSRAIKSQAILWLKLCADRTDEV